MAQELNAWGNRFKTSWFRVAVTAIGLLIRANSEADHGSDQNVAIAFGGRPSGFETTVGHFANALPIRIPYTGVLCKSTPGSSPTFDDFVQSVSRIVSEAKKYERVSITDIHREANTKGSMVNRTQVAITLSPKVACAGSASIYPVEGTYDLFFCFLEEEESVSLGVSGFPVFLKVSVNDYSTGYI